MGEYDAIVLAAAGVKRLGLEDRISAYLPLETFLPAVSQGALGVQVRGEDREVASWVKALEDPATRDATTAERAFLRAVEGGCHVPVGAYGEVRGTKLRMSGIVCSLDGCKAVEGKVFGVSEEAESLGMRLAEDVLARGGEEILQELRDTTDDD